MNPRAGMMRANRKLADIITLFSSYGYENTVCMTSVSGDGTRICKAKAGEMDLVVCIGGDGTLNEIIMGMIESGARKPIGYIPAGTTNDFASSLKLSKNIMKAASDIMEGTPHALDIGRFNERCFSYIASCGAFTRVAYTTPQSAKNVWGHTAYVLESIKELSELQPIHLRIETKDQIFEDNYIFAAISNSTSVAGILALDSTLVEMNDGLFEIMLIKFPTTPAQFMDIIIALNKQDYSNAMIHFSSIESAVIQASNSMDWTLDGEYMQGSKTIQVQNIRHAVEFIVNRPTLKPVKMEHK